MELPVDAFQMRLKHTTIFLGEEASRQELGHVLHVRDDLDGANIAFVEEELRQLPQGRHQTGRVHEEDLLHHLRVPEEK